MQNAFTQSLQSIAHFAGAIFVRLFGEVTWRPPAWGRGTINMIGRHRWLALAAAIIAVAGVAWTYHLLSQPKPRFSAVTLRAPAVTPLQTELHPQPAFIEFAQSAAPLGKVGTVVRLAMTPNLPGQWKWTTDRTLTFQPASDWPASTVYRVTLLEEDLAKTVRLEKPYLEFKTSPLEVKIVQAQFYQDPVDLNKRQIVATIETNFPVATGSLQKQIAIDVLGGSDLFDKNQTFELTANVQQRRFFLHSANIKLPEHSDYVRLAVRRGLLSVSGQGTTDRDEVARVAVPDRYSFFHIDDIKGAIARRENGDSEQILTLATSVNTKLSDIAAALQIWLLPERKDAGADTIRPWKSANEISEEILASAQRLPITSVAEKEQFSKEHVFRCPVSKGGQVFVRVAKETPAIGGYLLADDYVQIVNLDPLPREIVINGGLLALNGERTLSIVSRGVQSIEFEIAKVLPNQIHHLVSQTSGAFDRPEFLGDNFDERNISVISRPTQQIADEGNGTAKYSSLKLDPYLESEGKLQYGLFFIRPRAIDPVTHETFKARTETRFVLVTDLGIIAKRNSDQSREIFVASLKNERPIAGVHISILAKNGTSVFDGTTDEQGHVHTPVLDEKEVNERDSERKPVAIVAQRGDDLSFLAYERDENSLDFSRFDITGALTPLEPSVEVFPFTDRGVYRPGEVVRIGLIVKSSSPSTGGIPLSVDLRDSSDTSVEVKQITVNGFGETQFELPETASTGEYHLVIQLDDKAQESIADYYFHVEDFQPDRMKITVFGPDPMKQAWLLPAELGVNVHLENLFGTPANANKISAKQKVNPGGFHIPRWKEFTFYNPSNYQTNHPEYNEEQELEDVQTDEHGDTRVNADLSKYSNACYRVDLDIEGFEADGGRSVHGSAGFIVSDREFVVGYRTDAKLSFLPYQQPASIELLAVNRASEPIAISNARCRIIEKRKEPVITRQDNGTYKYEPVLQETTISDEPFSLTAQARPCPLATDRIGNFRMEIVDQDGRKLFATDYAVTGSTSGPVALDHDGELRVALNSGKMAPGDTVEMTVEAPFAGYGLITIERNRVFAWKWFRAETQTSIQTIAIPKDFEGAGYVNVSFVRSLNSNDTYTAPLSYAVVPFQAIAPQRKINLSLDLPKNAKPGEKLGIKIKADRDCRVVVYGVDIGILQVSDYELPNPLDWRFQKRQLEVLTHQALDSLLPEYSRLKWHSAPGGGDEHVAKNLNPFTRATEKPVVFWSGVIHAGPQSQELSYPIPDFFDGSIRIMAVADALDGEGSTQVDLAVHGPLIITPQAPLAAIPGDDFIATTSLTNASEGELDTEVRLESEGGLKGSGSPAQHIHLAKNGITTLRWPIHVTEPLGNAVLRFTAKLPEETVQRKRTLSIRPPTPRLTLIENGKLGGSEKEIELREQFYPQYLSRSAALSATPTVLVGGLTKFLENYPFDCSEQLTSAAFANLLASPLRNNAATATRLNAALAGYFKTLAERQGSDGAFHYWNIDDSESPEWISVYVMEFFTEAKEAGIKIPADLDRQAVTYLKNLAARSPTSLHDGELAAKAIYLLTRREFVMTNELVNLRDQLDRQFSEQWKSSLCGVYLAGSAQMLMKQRDANEWISHYRVHAESSGTEVTSPLGEDAQYLTIIARHFPGKLSDLQPKQIEQVFRPLLGDSFNTVSAAYSLRALKACQGVLPAGKVNLQISEWINGWKPLVIDASNSAQVPSNASKLRFTVGSQSSTSIFYQVTQSGFPRSIAPISAGLEVRRDYVSDKDETLRVIRVGDTIHVRIRVRSTTGSVVENVAIVDLLPSGFEVVRDESGEASLKSENLSHFDVREDRVILYVNAEPGVTEIRYEAKVTAAGKLIVPPISAQAMYNQAVQAVGETGVVETR